MNDPILAIEAVLLPDASYHALADGKGAEIRIQVSGHGAAISMMRDARDAVLALRSAAAPAGPDLQELRRLRGNLKRNPIPDRRKVTDRLIAILDAQIMAATTATVIETPAKCEACGDHLEDMPDDGFGALHACLGCGWEPGKDPAAFRSDPAADGDA